MVYTILVMGEKGCGKSSFVKSLTKVDGYTEDISVLYECNIGGKIHKMRLQESCDCALIPEVDAILYLYDVSNNLSDEYQKALIFIETNNISCPLVLVGCKYDKCDNKHFIQNKKHKHIYISNWDERQVRSVMDLLIEELDEEAKRAVVMEIKTLRNQVNALKIVSSIMLVGGICVMHYNKCTKSLANI